MILIDSNVLIDVIGDRSVWFDWSFGQLQRLTADADLLVNAVVVGEVAPRFGSLDDFLAAMATLLVRVEGLSSDAAFLAGITFQQYRAISPDSRPKSILADFLIGGDAQHRGASILTRDQRFYRRYFADVPLITPETHP